MAAVGLRVTIDMSSAHIKTVKESVPDATLIFDRFHVQRLVHDAVDEVHRKESLATILDGRQVNVERRKLDQWLGWARESERPAFVRVAATIEKHREGILAYVRTRLNNGRVEGLNGKARVTKRRAFGFHSASAFITTLFLCCGGIETHPFHIAPRWTH